VTLPEKLAAFRAQFEETVRSAYLFGVLEAMDRAKDELVASGAADRALKVGDLAPSFALRGVDGQEVSSRDFLRKGPLVVTFYRGFWCPYCNIDLQALQEALPAIAERGARLIAISPQTQSHGDRSQRQNGVTFPILSDPGNEVAASFRLRFKLPEYLTRLYLEGFKLDLTQVNGDPSWTLPMPARYVIGTDGVIKYAEVSPDHTYRPDPAELLPVLSALGKQPQDRAGGEITPARLA
jgi:peroxiredoxin